MVALETPLAKNQLSEVLSVYHEHLNHLKLDNLDLNDKLAPLFEIPYPVLRSWIVNQVIPLEQKGVTVRLDVNVDAYPNNLNVAVLIRVLERCMNLAEKLWAKEPETDIGFLIQQNEDAISALFLRIPTRKLIRNLTIVWLLVEILPSFAGQTVSV